MQENFRQFLDRLRQTGELVDLHQPVDIRHIATLVDQSDKALWFHDVIGYGMPVVSGIIRTRERTTMGIAPLPKSLYDAIAIAEKSELLAETLGEHVFDFFLRNKRAEWEEYRTQVSAFERDRMLPVL